MKPTTWDSQVKTYNNSHRTLRSIMDATQEALGSAPAPACPANNGQAVNFIQEVQASLFHFRFHARAHQSDQN